MTKAALKQTDVTRVLLGAIDALERRGHDVKAVHIAADGGMTVLTEAPMQPVESTFTEGDWVTYAGKEAIPSA